MDSYGRELVKIATLLERYTRYVRIIGDDAARFVFAESARFGVEISKSSSGWWIEYFEGDIRTSEQTFASVEETVQAVCVFLRASLLPSTDGNLSTI